MSHDAQSADSLLRENADLRAEIARLQTDLAGVREERDQAWRAEKAERDARSRYDIIVHCARAVVHNDAPANITRLAAAIDAVDRATKARAE